MFLLSSSEISKLTFFQNILSGILSLSHVLDPDQDICSAIPILGPNHLLRLSADDESCRSRDSGESFRSRILHECS